VGTLRFRQPSVAVLATLLAWAVLSFVVVMGVIGTSVRGGAGAVSPDGPTPTAFTFDNPANGTVTHRPTIVFSGEGPPGATITIGDAVRPQTTVAADRSWRATVQLLPGKHPYAGIARFNGVVTTSVGFVTVTYRR
jgi:hypothetical protein